MENRPMKGSPKRTFLGEISFAYVRSYPLLQNKNLPPATLLSPCTGSTRLTTISEVWAPQVLSPTVSVFSVVNWDEGGHRCYRIS